MADEKMFRLRVISPERVFYEDDVAMVELNTTEGEIGVLPEHIPLTTIVAPGVLRIMKGEETREAAVLSGFMEIKKDAVTILAESCEWPEEIDLNRAKEAQIRAERRIKSGNEEVNLVRAEAALKRALTRIGLAEKYM
ncbi:MAG: ATP synthase F1 subunit epsilon [Lachnospiraceae bacterium]|nr:ATP synthase F1 subunit epsilon [Lachnospiraceae bacterium]